MKMQNILGALLLVMASQAAYAIEVRIRNLSDKPMKMTLIYKNNKRYTNIIEPADINAKNWRKEPKLFSVATQANPIKEIMYSYIGDNTLWSVPIHGTKNTNVQFINISYPKYVVVTHYNVNQDNFWLNTGEELIDAKEVLEDI